MQSDNGVRSDHAISGIVVREDFSDEETFEQRPEGCEGGTMQYQGKSILGKRDKPGP